MLWTRAADVSSVGVDLAGGGVDASEELARVDAWLDDPVFFAPFVPFFDPRVGRPSTPMETYLRIMFLKFRHRLGLRTGVPRGQRLDHLATVLPDPVGRHRAAPATLMKVTTGCGTAAVGRLQRGVTGQGRAGEAAARHPAARRHHGGAR